jgi:hypothetical protein
MKSLSAILRKRLNKVTSLNGINRLVFVTDTPCVYRDVRTEFLHYSDKLQGSRHKDCQAFFNKVTSLCTPHRENAGQH